MELPIPWKNRKSIRAEPELGKAQKRDDKAKTAIPRVKNLFLPQMSAALPRGTMNTAIARRWAVTTHPRRTASIPNSVPMGGRATLIAEFAKAGRKAATVAMKRTLFLLSASLINPKNGEGIFTISPRRRMRRRLRRWRPR